MRRTRLVLCVSLALSILGPLVAAETAQTPDPSTAGLDHLRAAVKEAYNRGDVEAMAHFLHPEVVVIFPDGSVLKGRQAFRDYYTRMLKAPGHRVASYSADPVVESRTLHNDVGLSYGHMNDRYVLTDGKSFGLDSRFTITVFKSPDGPAESDGWTIRSFHSSADVFDNDILSLVAHRVFLTAGLGGLVVGLVLGAVLAILLSRRRSLRPPPAPVRSA